MRGAYYILIALDCRKMEDVFSRMQNHLGKRDLLDIVQSLMKLVPEGDR